MKNIIAPVLFLALCLSMTACMKTGTSGNASAPTNESAPTLNVDAEPEIVLSENSIELENRYDLDGTHVGYYRYTYGTNCGNEGLMLIEFTDLKGNVLNTYSPKFAGGVLSYGQTGKSPHNCFEITDIWESDYSDAVNSNSYMIVPCSGGTPYAYIENRAGRTIRCDLFGADSQVVASIAPADPKNTLDIFHVNTDHFNIVEGYVEERANGPTHYAVRDLYYDLNGTLLCDLTHTYTENPESQKKVVTRCDVKNASGVILRTYELSGPDSEFEISYDIQAGAVFASEKMIDYQTMRMARKFTEYFDPAINLVLYREDNIYENGAFSHTAFTVYGGRVVTEDSPIAGTYKRLEFYDAQGVLKQTVETVEGHYVYFKWSKQDRLIEIWGYDKSGNETGFATYDPSV